MIKPIQSLHYLVRIYIELKPRTVCAGFIFGEKQFIYKKILFFKLFCSIIKMDSHIKSNVLLCLLWLFGKSYLQGIDDYEERSENKVNKPKNKEAESDNDGGGYVDIGDRQPILRC